MIDENPEAPKPRTITQRIGDWLDSRIDRRISLAPDKTSEMLARLLGLEVGLNTCYQVNEQTRIKLDELWHGQKQLSAKIGQLECRLEETHGLPSLHAVLNELKALGLLISEVQETNATLEARLSVTESFQQAALRDLQRLDGRLDATDIKAGKAKSAKKKKA